MRTAFLFISISLLTTGCGGYSTKAKSTRQSANFVTGAADIPFSGGTGTGGTEVPSEPASTGIPPLSFRVDAIGYTSTTVKVSARNVLKIRFAPGVNDKTISGSNVNPQYAALGVYITVNGTSLPTPLLFNGYFSGTSQETSDVLDFSNAFARTCASDDTLCRETVTIKIEKPNNDYWCVNYGAYCPYTHVPDNHPWNGTLKVQTDDTDPV